MSRRTLVFVLLLCIFSIEKINAAEICSIGGQDPSDFNGFIGRYIEVNDTSIPGVILSFNTTNVIDAQSVNPKYIKVSFGKDKVISVHLTDAFINYEEDESNSQNSEYFTLVCSNGPQTEDYKMEFRLHVKLENNHDPIFSQKKYEYVVYTGLEQDFDLSDIMEISATDGDISSSYPRFSIEDNDDFQIDTNYKNGKTVTANLKTKHNIIPPFDRSYKIKIDDNDYPSRFTYSYVTVKLEKSTDSMSFEEASYSASIEKDILTVHDVIRLKQGFDTSTVFTIISDYAEFITVTTDVLRNTINLSLSKPIPTPRSGIFSLNFKLKASWKGLEATTEITTKSDKEIKLLCKLGDISLKEKTYKHFEKVNDTYRGTINVINKTLNIAAVTCSGSKYLECSYENNALTIFITDAFENFERDEDTTEIRTTMKIDCPYGESFDVDYLVKIEDINNHDPEFDRKLYKYVFYNPLPSYFSLSDIIDIRGSDLDVGNWNLEFSVNEHYDLYLSLGDRLINKTASASLSTRVPIVAPFNKTYELLIEDSGDPMRNNTAQLNLQVWPTKDFQFEKEQFVATIDGDGEIVFIGDVISMINGFDSSTQFKFRSEYSDVFDVYPDILKNRVELRYRGNLSEIPTPYITGTIEAAWQGLRNYAKVHVQLDGTVPTTITPLTEESSTAVNENTSSTTESNDVEAVEVGVGGQLKGFTNWILTSTIIQIVVLCTTFIGMIAMIYAIRKYY